MAQYDVHELEPGYYAVVLQSGWLDTAETRVVAPLCRAADLPGLGLLTPRVDLGGEAFLIATQLLFAIRSRDLRRPIGNVASHRDDITRALDFLFTGF